MEMNDLILVSVDDHIIEPPGLFERHIPAKYKDRAPRLGFDEATQTETWSWEGGSSTTAFVNAVVTLPQHEWGFDPALLSEIRPACYDLKQRVRDMDRRPASRFRFAVHRCRSACQTTSRACSHIRPGTQCPPAAILADESTPRP